MVNKDVYWSTVIMNAYVCAVSRCREEMQAGIRRRYEIMTHGIDVWHVLEYDHYKLPEASHGQFHAGDTYVIRWNYSTLQTGESSRSTATVCSTKVLCPQNLFPRKSQRYKGRMSRYVDIRHLCFWHRLVLWIIDKITMFCNDTNKI